MDVFSRDVKIAEEITRILVFNGAKLNLIDSEKLSPLHRAVMKRHIEGIKLIIRLNKELGERGKELFDINLAGGEKKYAPLFYALERKDTSTSELLFISGAKVWIRWDGEYMPREWKKRESNVRRHILWKMERYELQSKTGRISFTEHLFNNEEIVNKTEGVNNWINGYTTVGSYLRRFNRSNKTLLIKEKKSFKGSWQKILFTINNPALKEGDIEVEDINVDSDIDIWEEKDAFSSLNNNFTLNETK